MKHETCGTTRKFVIPMFSILDILSGSADRIIDNYWLIIGIKAGWNIKIQLNSSFRAVSISHCHPPSLPPSSLLPPYYTVLH